MGSSAVTWVTVVLAGALILAVACMLLRAVQRRPESRAEPEPEPERPADRRTPSSADVPTSALSALSPEMWAAIGSMLSGIASMITSVTALVLAFRRKETVDPPSIREIEPPAKEPPPGRDGYL